MLNLEIQLMRYSSNSTKLNLLLRPITPFQKPKVSKSSKKKKKKFRIHLNLPFPSLFSLLPSPFSLLPPHPLQSRKKKKVSYIFTELKNPSRTANFRGSGSWRRRSWLSSSRMRCCKPSRKFSLYVKCHIFYLNIDIKTDFLIKKKTLIIQIY